MGTKVVFQFKIIINVLAVFALLEYICYGSTLYGHYNFVNPFSARTALRRQILTSKDGPRTERVNNTLSFILSNIY